MTKQISMEEARRIALAARDEAERRRREFEQQAAERQDWPEQHAAVLCPICQGSGVRGARGAENRPMAGTCTFENCHGCGGTGWVVP